MTTGTVCITTTTHVGLPFPRGSSHLNHCGSATLDPTGSWKRGRGRCGRALSRRVIFWEAGVTSHQTAPTLELSGRPSWPCPGPAQDEHLPLLRHFCGSSAPDPVSLSTSPSSPTHPTSQRLEREGTPEAAFWSLRGQIWQTPTLTHPWTQKNQDTPGGEGRASLDSCPCCKDGPFLGKELQGPRNPSSWVSCLFTPHLLQEKRGGRVFSLLHGKLRPVGLKGQPRGHDA